MNSEELEISLRTEFESYLRGVLAGIRQDVSDFQKNFEAEFEKHKAQMDEALRKFSARFESEPQFDKAFTESVIEHLRLARDAGAQLSASAFEEAEKLKTELAPASYDLIRDAIEDISSKTTQSAILKALVHHAANFTPRGAFFIVKNDHFVGWRVFGKDGERDDAAVQGVHFSISAETILASAVSTLQTSEGAHGSNAEDALFLEPLDFGRPDRMYAIPLTARGRGVAVLYADYGTEGISLNVEALETLVRVAGLTVELRAASQMAKSQARAAAEQPVTSEAVQAEPEQNIAPEPAEYTNGHAENGLQANGAEEEPRFENTAALDKFLVKQYYEEYKAQLAAENESQPAAEPERTEDPVAAPVEEAVEFEQTAETEPANDVEAEAGEVEAETEEAEAPVYFEPEPPAAEVPATDYAFASNDSYGDLPQAETEAVEVQEEYSRQSHESNGNGNGNGHDSNSASYEPAPVFEVAQPQPVRSRLSDRNVDLPIEVSDEERRLHNDARRFARLLVSEIKLYNEQRVNEGREMGDLYDRLREAIDRSREMYDRRVKPQVAAKFDYFDYELVNSLAEGDAGKLGASYPGAVV